MGAGPLAIGASDVDGAEAAMRVAEVLVKGERGAEPLLISADALLLEQRSCVEEIFYGFAISHCIIMKDFYLVNNNLAMLETSAEVTFMSLFVSAALKLNEGTVTP